LPKTVTRQRRGCDLNSGFSAPESSTLTSRLPSHSRELAACVQRISCTCYRTLTPSTECRRLFLSALSTELSSLDKAKSLPYCIHFEDNDLVPGLQNILQQSYDYLTIMPKLRSTYDGRLTYETSYEVSSVLTAHQHIIGHLSAITKNARPILRYNLLAKS